MTDFFNFHSSDRYTVDTILKLCLHRETAKDSFKLLYGLANGESELKNSANIEFVSLFQIYLAETCLSLEERLLVLDVLVEENEMSSVIINAYERALKSNSFTGRIQSGKSNNRDNIFNPNSGEISSYYNTVIEKLSSIALAGDEPFSKQAFDSILSRAYDQISIGNFNQIFIVINEFIQKQGEISNDTRQKLRELSSDRYELDKDFVEAIKTLLDKYKPESIEEQLTAFVVLPAWINDRDEQGNYINVSSEKAKELAQKYLDGSVNWKDDLDVLLKGEQRQTYSFSQIVGEKGGSDSNKALIDLVFDIFKTIPTEEQNSAFVSGLIYGSKNDVFTRYAIDKLLSSNLTEVHGIRLIRYLNPIEYEDLLKIKNLLIATPKYLRNLEYLDLIHLNDDEVVDLVGWIKDFNYSFALEILYEILRKDVDRWNSLKGIINELLYVDKITEYSSFINSTFHIEDLISKSIYDDPSDKHISFLVHQIIKNYTKFNFENESFLDHLTYFFINDFFDESWPIFGEHLASGQQSGHKLYSVLEKSVSNNKLIYDWAITDSNYPPTAIRFMNIYKKNDDGSLEWDQYAKQLVDEFGNQQKVLDNIHSKFINYSMIGFASASGLYKKRKVLVDQLLDHKFDNVKEFAKNLSEYLSSQIVEEDKFGENYELEI
ncbi:hypothetical protein [Formosa sp. 4Alg 33]|uniref:hypothetical protein n=1 Tax=Formosa sp. 4Alg 33 TaxID=3382189 RepID=UPI003D9C44C7